MDISSLPTPLDALRRLGDGWWKDDSRLCCSQCRERYATWEHGDRGEPWGGIHEEPVEDFTHGPGCPVPAIEAIRK